MFSGIRDKRLARVNYKLNKFSYCRVLNDRVRCGSLTNGRNMPYRYNKYGESIIDEHLHMKEEESKEQYINRPCFTPLLAIRKWKWWIRSIHRKDRKNTTNCHPMNWFSILVMYKPNAHNYNLITNFFNKPKL